MCTLQYSYLFYFFFHSVDNSQFQPDFIEFLEESPQYGFQGRGNKCPKVIQQVLYIFVEIIMLEIIQSNTFLKTFMRYCLKSHFEKALLTVLFFFLLLEHEQSSPF